jgi:hypothetical protein
VSQNLPRCKQHVHVFAKGPLTAGDKILLPDGRTVDLNTNSVNLCVIEAKYDVILRNPLEEVELTFLWPIRCDVTETCVILRMVVMERNPSNYFDRECYLQKRTPEEQEILETLEGQGLHPLDLHKGIKALWAQGFMDSPKTQYKKPRSSAQEVMDEGLGIRENEPALYDLLQQSTLFTTTFVIPEASNCHVQLFRSDPSRGFLHFPRYSEGGGDTDEVVQKVLANNQ